MHCRFTILALVAVLSAAILSAAPLQRVQSDQEILIQLERDWDTAYHNADVAFIERLLADEFMGTYGDGTRCDIAE